MFIILTDINGCVAYYEHTAIIGIKKRNAAMNGSGEIHEGSELLLVSGQREWVAEVLSAVVEQVAEAWTHQWPFRPPQGMR